MNISIAPQVHSYIQTIQPDIDLGHDAKQYRPVAVAIVEDARSNILFVRSAKGPFWGFPQGDINRSENILTALARELFEETGMSPEEVFVQTFCGWDKLDIPGRPCDGFQKGNIYYYFHLLYRGSLRLTLNERELSDYTWKLWDEAEFFLNEMLPESSAFKKKRESMLAALHKLRLG